MEESRENIFKYIEGLSDYGIFAEEKYTILMPSFMSCVMWFAVAVLFVGKPIQAKEKQTIPPTTISEDYK